MNIGKHLRIFPAVASIVLALWVEPLQAETLTFIWHKGPCAEAFTKIAQNYPF